MPEPIAIIPNTWTEQIETFLNQILDDCKTNSETHMKAGYKKKKLNIALSIPPIVIPAFMTPIAAEFSEERWLQILSPIVYAFVAVAAALTAFFAYAKKSEQHFKYAANYNDIVTDIQEELCKETNMRHGANAFLSAIKTKYDSYGANAPII